MANFDEKTYDKHKDFINDIYDKLSFHDKVDIFRFSGRYPENKDIPTFESVLIDKYVLRGKPEDDYLMFLIRDKQKMFDELFLKFCEEECDQKSYLLLEKIIFLFLEYKKDIKVENNHLLKLTKAMRLTFSFVLAAFISKNEKILENTPFAEIFLPRLMIFIERSRETPDMTPCIKDNEVPNEPNVNLPHTIQEAIFKIEEGDLSPDILVFYIFTAPSEILLAYKDSLFPLFLRCTSSIFFAIFYERTHECSSLLHFFIENCSESEKYRIIEAFNLLKGTQNFRQLTEEIIKICKNKKISGHIRKFLSESLGMNL